MEQRTTTSPWWAEQPRRPGTPIRLLIESDDPVLAISSFSVFRQAGIEVALCAGPSARADECPLVRGEHCGLADGADVVIFDLDASMEPGEAVLASMRETHPDVPVLVTAHRSNPPGTVEAQDYQPLDFPMSVAGQVRAVRAAATRR